MFVRRLSRLHLGICRGWGKPVMYTARSVLKLGGERIVKQWFGHPINVSNSYTQRQPHKWEIVQAQYMYIISACGPVMYLSRILIDWKVLCFNIHAHKILHLTSRLCHHCANSNTSVKLYYNALRSFQMMWPPANYRTIITHINCTILVPLTTRFLAIHVRAGYSLHVRTLHTGGE